MTIPARDEDTPFQSGDGDTVERREREAVRDQIARLKRHLRNRIREDAMDRPKSPYSLMPAQAIAQRLSATSREEFWTALAKSIQDGAFDLAPPTNSRRLYVFDDRPLLRLTSNVFDDIAEIDGPDPSGVFEGGYLKNAWASIQTWRNWCPGDRFVLPPSWERTVASLRHSADISRQHVKQQDLAPEQPGEPRKIALVRAAMERLGSRDSCEPVKAYQARICADIAKHAGECISHRHLAGAERIISGRQPKKAKKGKKALPSIASERG